MTRAEVKAELAQMNTKELEAYSRVLAMSAKCLVPDPQDQATNALHADVVRELLKERR